MKGGRFEYSFGNGESFKFRTAVATGGRSEYKCFIFESSGLW